MPFNLFRKKKQPEQQENVVIPPQEESQAQTPIQPPEEPQEAPEQAKEELTLPPEEPTSQVASPAMEEQQQAPIPTPEPQPTPAEEKPATQQTKTYLKAMPLRDLADLDKVKSEVQNGNIVILKVTPLATKSIEDVKSAVNDLYQFAENIGGDIARLGEERVVICPKSVRIWREKTPAPVQTNEPCPTAA